MTLSYNLFDLKLRVPFTIAHGSRTHTPLVLVELKYDNVIGYGEASLPPYLKETQQSVVSFLHGLHLQQFDDPKNQFENILKYISERSVGDNAAKAAVDIALHDLVGKLRNQSVSEILNVDDRQIPTASLTVSIGPVETVLAKINSNSQFNIFKVKLGSHHDEFVIRTLANIDKQFSIDTNQGWHDEQQVLGWLNILQQSNCIYVEQPFPVEEKEKTNWLRERINIPIIADEAVQTSDDLQNIEEYYDGINIKLMKSGGLAEARKMMDIAKEKDLKIVIGSMTETTCALTAAAHLAPMADWIDLDSQFMTANDPYTGMNIENGEISLDTSQAGLGVEKIK